MATGHGHQPLVAQALSAALEYFTPAEADHPDQKQAFPSRQGWAQFLERHFANVSILTTSFFDSGMSRTNLCFFASNDSVPFLPNWPDLLRIARNP